MKKTESPESQQAENTKRPAISGAKQWLLASGSQPVVSWGPVAAVIGAIVIYLLPQIVIGAALSIYPALKHWDSARTNDWLNSAISAQFAYTLAVEAISVAMIWALLKHYRTKFASIGIRRIKALDPFYAIIGFAVYMVVYLAAAAVLTNLIPALNVNQQQDIGFQNATGVFALMMAFVSLVVLPPIAEEIIFRGFVFTGFRRKFGFIISALATSILFATPHLLESSGGGLLWIGGVDTFVLSCVLCFIREKTGRLWAGMLVHALKNGVAFAAIFIVHAR